MSMAYPGNQPASGSFTAALLADELDDGSEAGPGIKPAPGPLEAAPCPVKSYWAKSYPSMVWDVRTNSAILWDFADARQVVSVPRRALAYWSRLSLEGSGLGDIVAHLSSKSFGSRTLDTARKSERLIF